MLDKIIDIFFDILYVLYISITLFCIIKAFNFNNLSNIKHPKHQQYIGIDSRVLGFYNEYKNLAKLYKINFNKDVTMGFRDLKTDKILASCYTGEDFREIDVNTRTWDKSTVVTEFSMIMHELTHCMCGRDHDFNDIPYKSDLKEALADMEKIFANKNIKLQGFKSDGCPESIMYPIIISDSCFLGHFDEYTKEMFDGCIPY